MITGKLEKSVKVDDDRCFDCKYHGHVNGLDTCAYESGLGNRYKCDRYEKDYVKTISFWIFLILLFGGTVVIPFIMVLKLFILEGVI